MDFRHSWSFCTKLGCLSKYNTDHFFIVAALLCETSRPIWQYMGIMLNTLRPRHKGRHFADDIFKCFFLNENVWIPIKFSLKFVPKGLINYIPALVQIMAWRRPGDKPLFEPMMISLLTHICVTRPQWVKVCNSYFILGTELRLLPNNELK